MKFRVFRTKTFEMEFYKLPKSEQHQIDKIEKSLSESPFSGKPLGLVFFREKRLNGRRIYFLVYENFVVILMAGISDKKTQQSTIDAIKQNLDKYYETIKENMSKL